MPPELRVGYFDVGILYAEQDRLKAEQYKIHLETYVSPLLDNKSQIKAVLFDGPEMMSLTGGMFKQLEMLMERCTQIFIYMTEVFCNEAWMTYATESCVVEAVYNVDRKWCCVPVFLHPRGQSPFRIPLCLNCLKGVNFYIDDQFYRRGACRLIEDKMYKRFQREREHEKKQRNWIFDKKKQDALAAAYDESQKEIARMRYDSDMKQHRRRLEANEAKCREHYKMNVSKDVYNPSLEYSQKPSKQATYYPSPDYFWNPESKKVPNLSKCSTPESPRDLDTEMRQIAQTKSNAAQLPANGSQMVNSGSDNITVNNDKFIGGDTQKVETNFNAHKQPRSNAIFDLQNEAISLYSSDSKCSRSSTPHGDAVPSIQNNAEKFASTQQQWPTDPPKTESLKVAPNLESGLDPPQATSMGSCMQTNMPYLFLLNSSASGSFVEEFDNKFDDENCSETISDVQSGSRKSNTLPLLSLFNSSDGSELMRSHITDVCSAVSPEMPPSHSSAVPPSQTTNPPHPIKSTLPEKDLFEDAHSVNYEEQQDIGRPTLQGRKPKVIIREIHHHHYEARDQPSKV